jgi:hypothetical protein
MFGNDIYILIEEDVVRESSMRPASKRIRLLELALDESERLGAVLVDVLLVCVGIIAVAAVRVGGVAVRLDDAGAGWRAFEATGTGGELVMSEIVPISFGRARAYASCSAGSDIVWQTVLVVRVPHEDGRLNGVESIAGKRRPRAATEGVVKDLSALYWVSTRHGIRVSCIPESIR